MTFLSGEMSSAERDRGWGQVRNKSSQKNIVYFGAIYKLTKINKNMDISNGLCIFIQELDSVVMVNIVCIEASNDFLLKK